MLIAGCEYLDAAGAASFAFVSKDTILKAARRRELRSLKWANKVFFRPEWVTAWTETKVRGGE